MDSLPNVHVSRHPCLHAKLSQLRSQAAEAKETKLLIHEISLMLGTEALASLELVPHGTVSSPLSELRLIGHRLTRAPFRRINHP